MKIHFSTPIANKMNLHNLSRIIGAFSWENKKREGFMCVMVRESGNHLYVSRMLQSEEMTLQLCFSSLSDNIVFTLINDEPLGGCYGENELHKHSTNLKCYKIASQLFFADWLQVD